MESPLNTAPEIPGSGAALEHLLQYMEEAWPHEACGALFVSPCGKWKWQPIKNTATRPTCTFVFGEAWFEWLCQEEKNQSTLACLVHSHPNGEAHLSKADIQSLAPGGRRLWPKVLQMVVSTGAEGWRELAWYEEEGEGFKCLGRKCRRHFETRKTEKFKL